MAAMVVSAVGCTSSGGDPSGDNDPGGSGSPDRRGGTFSDDIVLAGALTPFDACDDLLDYVIDHGQDLVGPYGLGGGFGYAVTDDAAETEVSAPSAEADGAGLAAPAEPRAAVPQEGVDYSGTNVQESGVDEPDAVKTDGEYLYLVRGRTLEIVDVTGDEPEVASSIDLDGWDQTLLRAGDRLLVMGHVEGGRQPVGADSVWGGSGGTALMLYDVSDATDPELVSTLQLDGQVVSSRLIDGVARVVLRAEPVGLQFVTPQGSGLRAERDATEQNKEIIAESTIDNWVPYYIQTSADGSQDEGSLLPCDRVGFPEAFAGLGTTSVLSLDLSDDLSPDGSAGVLAGSGTVYASDERLYVATNQWYDWELLSEPDRRDVDETFSTDVHAFDITDPDGARYVGSGTVRGHVLNQWAMSEHDGVLRVATTEGSPWGWDGSGPASESFVTTFAEQDGALAELGQVGGLGKDERIYAVRFMGDVGYVVTFRETDPLYTLDLSDPADPEVLGELKILGYSAYLHPIDDGLILGVGQDADERGRTQGTQLSLFDVSDLANPERIHQVTLEDAQSQVEWNHHAFLHWPPTGLTVIPFQSWQWDEATETESVDNGAVAYELGLGAGFDEAGRLTHVPDDITDSTDPRYWDVAWQAAIQRSVVIGDTLYTISELGVKGSDLDTLADESWLPLPTQY
jgi:hypothetical protein